MANFKRLLETSLNLFIYKLLNSPLEALCDNKTLSDDVIEAAYAKTGDDMSDWVIKARLRLRSVMKERKIKEEMLNLQTNVA